MIIDAKELHYGLFPAFCLIASDCLRTNPGAPSNVGLFYLRDGLLGEAVFTLLAYQVNEHYIPCEPITYSQSKLAGGKLRVVKNAKIIRRFLDTKKQIDEKYAVSEKTMAMRCNSYMEPYRDHRYPDILIVYLVKEETEIKILPSVMKKTVLKGTCREYYPSLGLQKGQYISMCVHVDGNQLLGEIIQ